MQEEQETNGLNKHDNDSLIKKKDELSFVMLINKIKSAEEFRSLRLPNGYLDNLFQKSPEDVLKVIARVIAVVLRKQYVPENDIQDLVDKIERRQNMGLFDEWQGFNVQEERLIGQTKGEEIKLIKMICKKITLNWDALKIADFFDEAPEHIQEIYDIALKYAPDYDPEAIYNELSSKKELIEN